MKKNYSYLIILFLMIASLAAFGRIAGNDFINFDDPRYITENSNIQAGMHYENIRWAFASFVESHWIPLTLMSHMLDWTLFGANASGHHIVSMLLHMGAVIFLFLFLNRTTNNIWPAAFAAALFALHPLRVESVVWASERKDVLSMFFGMASLYAYALYAEKSKRSRYFLCLILFALSLMAKSMLVTLPFVFLLLDYWPLGRWQTEIISPLKNRFQMIRRLLWEKVPFFVLTILSSMMTLRAQYGESSLHLPFTTHVFNAIISYVAYLKKFFLPVDLVLLYPFKYFFPIWQILASCVILIVITIFVIYYIKKFPFLFVGWFWYLGTLIPVIGLMPISLPFAEHYTYLPSVGISIMLAWGIPSLIKNETIRKTILFPAGIILLAILSVLTWQQCGHWKNSITLFSHTLRVTKDNYIAHNHLGNALFEKGKFNEAIDHYSEAIRIFPSYAEAYYNRGLVYAALGQYLQTIEDNNKAVGLKKNYAEAYHNRGVAYSRLGQHQSALEDFNKAIRFKPDYAEAYSNRGVLYFNQNQKEMGCYNAQKACELGTCKLLEMAKFNGVCR